MKKYISASACIMTILLVSSCGANISKYKKNSDDGYITQSYISGGDESITDAQINSVNLSNWLGGEKLALEFFSDGKKTGGIPRYEVFFINNRCAVQIKLYGCSGINGDITQAFGSEYLTSFTAKQKDGALIIDITFRAGLKYMLEEFKEPSLLVLNIKEITT